MLSNEDMEYWCLEYCMECGAETYDVCPSCSGPLCKHCLSKKGIMKMCDDCINCQYEEMEEEQYEEEYELEMYESQESFE